MGWGTKGRRKRKPMNSVTFVITSTPSADGTMPYTVYRVSDKSRVAISHHSTLWDATQAAEMYASQARAARLSAHVVNEATG